MSLIDLNVGAIQEALRAGTISEAELVQAYLAQRKDGSLIKRLSLSPK